MRRSELKVFDKEEQSGGGGGGGGNKQHVQSPLSKWPNNKGIKQTNNDLMPNK